MAESRVDYSQWLKRGVNTFIPTDNAVTQPKLDPGIYNVRHAENLGTFFVKRDVISDDLIDLDSPEIASILTSLSDFWGRHDIYKKYGFVHKRGILLHGPPGSGKTSLINLLIDRFVKEHQGVVFLVQNSQELFLYNNAINDIVRTIDKDCKIMSIFEDIDGIATDHSESEGVLINVLDGINQIDNIVNIATTNYPERLSQRIMNRPNRFDRKILIGFASEAVREKFFRSKLMPEDLAVIDIKKWIRETEKLTIAHLGELIKSVIIAGNTFEEAIADLQKMGDKLSSFDYSKPNGSQSVGFKTTINPEAPSPRRATKKF